MDLEIQNFIYKFYKPFLQDDMQIKKKSAYIPQFFSYLTVGKIIRWLGKKALRKQYPPTWLAQPWAGRPLAESCHNTVFFAWEETRAYYFRASRIWTSVNVKRTYQCLLKKSNFFFLNIGPQDFKTQNITQGSEASYPRAHRQKQSRIFQLSWTRHQNTFLLDQEKNNTWN